MSKSKNESETVNFTVLKKFKAKIVGHPKAVQEILKVFIRGAAEQHIDEQHPNGRSREEVLKAISDRIRLAKRHFELGETDGFNCDLTDV